MRSESPTLDTEPRLLKLRDVDSGSLMCGVEHLRGYGRAIGTLYLSENGREVITSYTYLLRPVGRHTGFFGIFRTGAARSLLYVNQVNAPETN